jgi:hypothetical protein
MFSSKIQIAPRNSEIEEEDEDNFGHLPKFES